MHSIARAPHSGSALSTIYNLYEAKTTLFRLVDQAAAGEEIVIAKAGKPMAKLVAFPQAATSRTPGG